MRGQLGVQQTQETMNLYMPEKSARLPRFVLCRWWRLPFGVEV